MSDATQPGSRPSATGYAEVNGLRMYYEVHGGPDRPDLGEDTGRPLVLLHGGVLTIEMSFGQLLPPLAAHRRIIATELQGHGRTADIDRPLALPDLADDVIGLLDRLGVERADFFGFSLGGLTALQTAIDAPDRVGRLVLAATHFRPDGYHPEIRDPELPDTEGRLPTEADFRRMQETYADVAPDPGHFDAFLAKVNTMVGSFQGWSDDTLRAVAAPTLIVVGDNDFVRLEHAAELHRLIPVAQLAVLPGTTHMELVQRPGFLLPMLEEFLPAVHG
ncbi:alpha/beta fold hydrolase [Streptomyces sp. NPDC101393]|uniref:alpha/beta fold hydrolase n=1 Tax=Streptomyces sp. NPDC101393 TaxID=3366141 RepID=UPI003811417F